MRRVLLAVLLLLTMTSPLFFGGAQGLSVQPDEMTLLSVRQGETALFHIAGNPNETVTLSASRIGPQGEALTVPIGRFQLDENGTASVPVGLVGDLGTVGTWQLLVTNGTATAKTTYRVDWDPVYLLNLQRQTTLEARQLWEDIMGWMVLWGVLVVSAFALLRIRREWLAARPVRWRQWLANLFPSWHITDWGSMFSTFEAANPQLKARVQYTTEMARVKGYMESLEDLDHRRQDLRHKAQDAATQAAQARKRALAQDPDDPFVRRWDRKKGFTKEDWARFGFDVPGEAPDG